MRQFRTRMMSGSASGGTGTYEYGYTAAGANALIDEVNAIVYAGESSAASVAKSGVSDIKTVCDDYWDGAAKDNFITNLTKDAEQFAEALQTLQTAFDTEVRNAASDYKSFDENLIIEK